jgi:RNA 3'-terminal phosphate cyclase
VEWLAEVSGAEVRGAEKGSRELLFLPGKRMPKGGEVSRSNASIWSISPGSLGKNPRDNLRENES